MSLPFLPCRTLTTCRAEGVFQEMYYWDTYFTNIGHLIYGNVELNALLYSMEMNMAYFAGELGEGAEEILWNKRAKKRAVLCRTYLCGNDGIFYDYDLSKKERTDTDTPRMRAEWRLSSSPL